MTSQNGHDHDARRRGKVNMARIKTAMKDTLSFAKKLGAGASELAKKLKKDKSPQAMIATLDENLQGNRDRRKSVSARVEKLFAAITEKKQAYKAAPKARQRVIEAELRTMLTEYSAAENELKILLENERVLARMRGRLDEMTAYDMAGVSDADIDGLIDEIEERVEEAESRVDAARDLEQAGKRRERESDRESLWAQLAEFEEEKLAPREDPGTALEPGAPEKPCVEPEEP